MTTISAAQKQAILDKLRDHVIPAGLGTEQAACTMASINLALGLGLIADTPDCMSSVLGAFVRTVQDSDGMAEIRNSEAWRLAAADACGSGRDPEHERQRLALLLDWMWVAMTELQPLADVGGYGTEWAAMTSERTEGAARAEMDAMDARAARDARAAFWQRRDPAALMRAMTAVGQP